jgi:hypothetical protein
VPEATSSEGALPKTSEGAAPKISEGALPKTSEGAAAWMTGTALARHAKARGRSSAASIRGLV